MVSLRLKRLLLVMVSAGITSTFTFDSFAAIAFVAMAIGIALAARIAGHKLL